eukprot:6191719-Pleurochrysis_carterae.AAC.3
MRTSSSTNAPRVHANGQTAGTIAPVPTGHACKRQATRGCRFSRQIWRHQLRAIMREEVNRKTTFLTVIGDATRSACLVV